MRKVNKNYLVERARIYREESQRAIELFLSGDIHRAELVEKTIIKSCCSELENKSQDTSNYYDLLENMALLLDNEKPLFENLDWIRVNCRLYLDRVNRS
ncbi:hypothetical protein [Liquorilactobacillus capillatus]|uniref:Uncharacterized protein n=1 Tax=Liquorilactobacillus capillatus DSM 19910 TaxID=1423731 RepID=A0A0R1M510_9LACO|nr:hypothetical protein [Liquorilactobacillus capillatus]KRL03148.1 hypothetical protein FC81_GL000149 [Liquorilactobacillus capillatus DSM 19910]